MNHSCQALIDDNRDLKERHVALQRGSFMLIQANKALQRELDSSMAMGNVVRKN